MTVSSTSSKSPLYTGNGTTGPWAFAFKTFAASELEVVQADASGIETVLTLTTDYTVSLNADQNNDPGGEVTTVAAVPNDGSTIIIRWAGEPTQGLDLQIAGGFYPEAQENAFDKLSMLVQKLAEETGRALRVTITAGETVGTEIGGSAAARANRYLGFDAAGDLTLSASFDAGALTVSAFMETVLDDTTAPAARTTLGAASLAENTFTGIQRWAKGADVASASALTLGTDGNYFDITGTTTITSINTLGVGTVVKLHFDAALILTNHATDLVLPGGANITTAAGDEAEFIEYATGDWRCTNYSPIATSSASIPLSIIDAAGDLIVGTAADTAGRLAMGTSLQRLRVNSGATALEWADGGGITLGTPVASTSGTSIDFTSIPAGTKRISINFNGVSTNGTSLFLVQIGDSGGIEATGYTSACQQGSTATGSTAGFVIRQAQSAAGAYSGTVTLTKENSASFAWVSSGIISRVDSTYDVGVSSGNKALSAELDRLRITTVGGADTFDAGEINITYE